VLAHPLGVAPVIARALLPATRVTPVALFGLTSSPLCRLIALRPGAPAVAFADRKAYIRAATELRMHELDAPIGAMRAGLRLVVPPLMLPLVRWRGLETRACGEPEVDLATLKAISSYEGCYSSQKDKHPVIERFWNVMGR